MKKLNKNKIYLSLLKKNGYGSYAKFIENKEKSKALNVLEDFIKIITKDKSSDQIKEIRNRYVKKI